MRFSALSALVGTTPTPPASRMTPRRDFFGLLVLVTAVACAAPPPPVVPTPEPEAGKEAPAPVPLLTVRPAERGELRCGIDDGPVPLGANQDEDDEGPLRRFALRPEAGALSPADRSFFGLRALPPDFRPEPPPHAAAPVLTGRWALGAGMTSSPTFVKRAHTCVGATAPEDLGEHGFTVEFAADGRAEAVFREAASTKPSQLLSCFQAALCETRRSDGSAGASTTAAVKATLTATTRPPVFHGEVTFTTLEDSAGQYRRDGTPTKRPFRRRGPFTPAEHAWHDGLGKMLEKGTLACARATPPSGGFQSNVRFPYDPRTRKFSATRAGDDGRNAFERLFQRCFAEAAVATLLPPPPGLVPNGAVTIVVTVHVREHDIER